MISLPEMPKLEFPRTEADLLHHRMCQVHALEVRNALLCEALSRTIHKIEGYQRAGWILGGGALEEARFTLIDARAVLAACEVKP